MLCRRGKENRQLLPRLEDSFRPAIGKHLCESVRWQLGHSVRHGHLYLSCYTCRKNGHGGQPPSWKLCASCQRCRWPCSLVAILLCVQHIASFVSCIDDVWWGEYSRRYIRVGLGICQQEALVPLGLIKKSLDNHRPYLDNPLWTTLEWTEPPSESLTFGSLHNLLISWW